MSCSTPGHLVNPWLVTGMGTGWNHGCWMLTTSHHVGGSDAECMMCLITVGPTLGANLLLQVLTLFLAFIHRNLTHALDPQN